jgi:hypothetical protein
LTIHLIVRIVAYLPQLFVSQEKFSLLHQVQRSRSDTAEDTDLVAALIDGTIAV